MFGDLAIGVSECVVNCVFFDFGDAGVSDDVDFVIGEFFLGVFADFFIVCV